MTDRFPWTVSTYPADASLAATCTRAACGGHRYLPRSYLLEKAGDAHLLTVERRLRCVEPGCGSAMTLEWVHRPGRPEANADYPKLPGLPRA